MDKKLFLLFFVITCFLIEASAQKKLAQLEVIYKQVMKHKPTDPEGVVDINFVMLSIGRTSAIVQDYAAYQTDSVKAIESADQKDIQKYIDQETRAAFYFDSKVVQDLEKQSLTVYDVIIPERFYYTEPLMSDWQLVDGNKDIAGYHCSKATIKYGDRHWIVWYTEQLPLPFGPWKLAGLPGLILSAEDESGEIAFELAELRTGKSPLPIIEKDNRTIKTNRDAFVERKNEVMKNPMANINTASISQMTVYKSTDGSNVMTINGDMALRINPNGYIPIEK